MLKTIFAFPMSLLRWFVNWRPGESHYKLWGDHGGTFNVDITSTDASSFVVYIMAFSLILLATKTEEDVHIAIAYFLDRASTYYETGGDIPDKDKATKSQVISTLELCSSILAAPARKQGTLLERAHAIGAQLKAITDSTINATNHQL